MICQTAAAAVRGLRVITLLKIHEMAKKGFTLIEILVGLTIISILFAVGYLNFRDFSRRQAIAGAAKLLLGDITLAEQQALSGQVPADTNCTGTNVLNGYDFQVVSTTEYWIIADCTGGPPSKPTKDVTLPSGIFISTPNPNPILFKVLGMGTNIPTGVTATITLTQTATTNTAQVIVGSGGRIQTQ